MHKIPSHFGYWIGRNFYTRSLYMLVHFVGIWTLDVERSTHTLRNERIQWNMVNSRLLAVCIMINIFRCLRPNSLHSTSFEIKSHWLMNTKKEKFPFQCHEYERKHTMTIFRSVFFFSRRVYNSRCFQLFIFRKSNRYASVNPLNSNRQMRMGWNVHFDEIQVIWMWSHVTAVLPNHLNRFGLVHKFYILDLRFFCLSKRILLIFTFQRESSGRVLLCSCWENAPKRNRSDLQRLCWAESPFAVALVSR